MASGRTIRKPVDYCSNVQSLEARRLLALANAFVDPLLELNANTSEVFEAELNGDSIPDIVGFGNGGVVGMLGNGNGTFQPMTILRTGGTQNLVKGDFNNDGRDDFIVDRGTAPYVLLLSSALSSYVEVPVPPSNIFHFAAADANNDGNLDIAAISSNAGTGETLRLWLGHGDGTFDAAPTTTLSIPGLLALSLGDLNEDGHADLILSRDQQRAGTFRQIGVLDGVGDGTFADPRWTNSDPGEIYLADLNQDGHLDVATKTRQTFTLSVHLGDGDGGLAPAVTSTVGRGTRRFVDFDQDSVLDLLTFGAPPPGVSGLDGALLSKGLGNGTFASPTRLVDISGIGSRQSAVADFNRDGTLDLAVPVFSGNIGIHFGNGSGGFQAPVRSPFPASPPVNAIVSADFNGDGLDDLASMPLFAGSVSVALQLSTGGYGTPIVSAMPLTQGNALQTGDFNGDGVPDLLTNGTTGSGDVHFLLGNGDGSFSYGSSLPFGVSMGFANIVIADFNNDGRDDLFRPGSPTGRLLLSDSNGTPLSSVVVPVAGGVSAVSGDFNQDSNVDLAVLLSGGTVTVLLGDGHSTFANVFTTQPLMISSGGRLHVGRFDAGETLDLVVTGQSALSIVRGRGDGTFDAPVFTQAQSSIENVIAVDIDSDGLTEIVGFNDHPSIYDLREDGAFALPSQQSSLSFNAMIIATDANSDGRMDIVLKHLAGSQTPGFFLNVGQSLDPVALESRFEIDTNAVRIQLDAQIDPDLLHASDLQITRVGQTKSLPATGVTISADGRTVVFTLPAGLADGDYRFAIPTGAIESVDGLANTSDIVVDTSHSFLLTGDINRDRTVNFSDLLILAQNYGQSGRTYSQGNVDYSADGVVGFGDLLLLAQRYGTSLFAAAPLTSFSTVDRKRDSVAGRDGVFA